MQFWKKEKKNPKEQIQTTTYIFSSISKERPLPKNFYNHLILFRLFGRWDINLKKKTIKEKGEIIFPHNNLKFKKILVI